ncbi:dermonecrotic toxin domain-containing protein [Pseudomonas monteilii]|uniref:dermonecrotic toxin domain-containing protein n=1 Tax=Pseudomonas monteilii TaxID=76759 RepID=UPI000A9B7510
MGNANVNNSAQSTAMDTVAMAQQFQDRLIAKRLPDWMGKVRVPDFPLLREALVTGLQSRQQLAKCWSRIEGLDSFCSTRLNTALKKRFDTPLDAEKHFLRQWYVYTSPERSYYTSHYPTPESDYFDVSLLSAAMSNFSKEQAAEGGQHVRNTLVDGPGVTVTNPSVLAFAGFCRELDLGGQYQRHLEAVLEGNGQRQDAQDCKALLQTQYRCNLLVDAFKAHAEGVLRDVELELMIHLYTHGTLGRLEGAPVVAKQLKAFDCHLQQIVVFDVIEEGVLLNSSKRVLVYIPGDRQGAWCTANNLESFTRKILGKRLREEGYRQFFERFVLQRDRPAFFASVQQRVGDVTDWATRELDQHMKVYPTPLVRTPGDDAHPANQGRCGHVRNACCPDRPGHRFGQERATARARDGAFGIGRAVHPGGGRGLAGGDGLGAAQRGVPVGQGLAGGGHQCGLGPLGERGQGSGLARHHQCRGRGGAVTVDAQRDGRRPGTGGTGRWQRTTLEPGSGALRQRAAPCSGHCR